MKIVYLNGPFRRLAYSRSSRSPAVTKSGTVYYPLWLSYAAGLAQQQEGFQVHLLDAVARRWSQTELIEHLGRIDPDLVFCDSSTPSIYEDLATAGTIKRALKDCRVVMVGTHATAAPEEVMTLEPSIDAVALGEYDQTAVDLAQALQDGRQWSQVAGIVLRQGERFIHTEDRGLIDNLDLLPFVSKVYRDHFKLEDYFFSAAQFPMVMIITSRGCPHRCQWCLYPQVMHRGKYRMRSSENVAAEFAYISQALPLVREVGIEDDLFTGSKPRLREICELLIRQKNKLGFWCDTRIDLDYETMRLMKAAGCRLLITGFESADQGILDRISKGTQAEQGFDFMRNARRAGLLVHGCFVLGNPGETEGTMQATLEMAKKLEPDTVQFFPMIVYPGTKMHQWARQNNHLRTEDYAEWLTPEGLHNSVLDLPDLPGQKVLRFCDHARREYYLRRRYVFRKLTQSLCNVHEARRNIKAFRRFARYLVSSA